MKNRDIQQFEADLRRLKPLRPPPELLERLALIPPPSRGSPCRRSRLSRIGLSCGWWFRWPAPAAIVVLAAAIWLGGSLFRPENVSPSPPATASSRAAFKADDVEFERQLIASFDTVAPMPDGRPVRFRYREWMDELVLRDSAMGIVIEQRTPRIEIVPVNFETY